MTFKIVGGTDFEANFSTDRSLPRSSSCHRAVLGFQHCRGVERPAARSEDVPKSETCANRDLRRARSKAWRGAAAATRYWEIRLQFEDATEWARRYQVNGAWDYPQTEYADRMVVMAKYRAALVEQILTPAPDVASVNWKRSILSRNDYVIDTRIKRERVEEAIAADLAFLRAHPMRIRKQSS